MLYRVYGSTLTAVGRSQLLARWPGTHSRILFGIQRAAQTVLDVYLKCSCSRITSASSALGVLDDYVFFFLQIFPTAAFLFLSQDRLHDSPDFYCYL